MSLNPQAPKKPDDLAFTLLSFPFDTLEAIGSRIASAFARKSKQQSKVAALPHVGESVPDITPIKQYMVADRVHRTEVRGRNVSFYQYHAAQIIRITCRELAHLKPINFTPAIAEGAALRYDIDGAIQWVRQNGLETNPAKPTPPAPSPRASKALSKPSDVKEEPIKVKTAATSALNIIPATGNKSVPFTGNIVSFGVTQIKSEGRKPYSTYAMVLRSETGAHEKQFIGEHLADLVTDMGLYEGQLVRLKLEGKHRFEVEVSGKMEERSRNHYAIETL